VTSPRDPERRGGTVEPKLRHGAHSRAEQPARYHRTGCPGTGQALMRRQPWYCSSANTSV
jgi:hypothetical protein